ncbi:formylmethanofuran dehydrogenase [Methanococcoides methylutens]|uniref:Tungsten-containing formylmethanofuran dehydrogenase 2 subunit C n=1 Tax=Methanococcoides methylutens MM1 TaxID=1434104 RepID=A0A0E3STN5_METMT|nr:formylmethanofuran dehydrogenase [Methanococcoides methylutens]AKB86082.1 Tungsten-containing formylmethanofuran dehydrogenase 2 subunit C [Methanococcoides methylutens MM1]
MIELELTSKVDHLCDHTFNFYWHEKELDPDAVIPSQESTEYTYRQIVDELKKGEDIRIKGSVGSRFAYSLGVDLAHFGGTGKTSTAGRIFVEGNVGPEAGMAMSAGALYLTGNIEEPLGNIIEVRSDQKGYRKFISITQLLCGNTSETPLENTFDKGEKKMTLNDCILRGTLASRCNCDAEIVVEGNVYNGTGLLMESGTITIRGNAGLNTGAHLNGGNVVVEGTAGEFAGAYMKAGILLFNDAKGYAGAGMLGGTIYSRKKIPPAPPAEKKRMGGGDSSNVRKLTGAGRVESMLYNKYEVGEEKEQYIKVKMRDGSIVMRKVD